MSFWYRVLFQQSLLGHPLLSLSRTRTHAHTNIYIRDIYSPSLDTLAALGLIGRNGSQDGHDGKEGGGDVDGHGGGGVDVGADDGGDDAHDAGKGDGKAGAGGAMGGGQDLGRVGVEGGEVDIDGQRADAVEGDVLVGALDGGIAKEDGH